MFDDFVRKFGKFVLNIVWQAGGIGRMFGQSVYLSFRRPFKFDYIFKQMEFVGVHSLLGGAYYRHLYRYGAGSSVIVRFQKIWR